MKRRNFLETLMLLSLAGGCSGGKSLPNSRHLVETPEKRAAYLSKMLKALCSDIGPHPCGSPEYDIAADIVKHEMELALPNVFFDTLTYDRWIITSDPEFYVGDTRLETFPSHGTGGTPPDGVRGVLNKSDINRVPYIVVDASGNMVARVTISESWATGLAVSRPYYYYDPEPGGLPTFNVGRQEIPFLDEAVAKAAPVRMKVSCDFIPDTDTSNVVGTIPGISSDEILLFAHLDTVYNSTGANDNTATLIMLLMLAHSLSGETPAKTVTFMATTGEEYGYLGTKQYAATRKNEGTIGNIKYVMNFDSVTWGQNMRIITDDDELFSTLTAIDEELGLDGTPFRTDSDGLGREASPLKEAGVDARGIVVDSGGYDVNSVWHRPEDTVDTVHGDCVEICFLLFREFLNRLQNV